MTPESPAHVPLSITCFIVRTLAIVALIGTLLFALTGCAGMPEVGKVQIIRTKEEVPVKCAVKEVKPLDAKGQPLERWPLDEPGIWDADIWTLARAATAEVELRIAYEVELKAANAACK